MVDLHEVFLRSRVAAMRNEALALSQQEWDEVCAALPDDDEEARGERSVYGTPVVIGATGLMEQDLSIDGPAFPQIDHQLP